MIIISRLYLIRHGLTEWNKENRFQGCSDVDLCEEGKVQARKLSHKLREFSFDVIYSSDLSRAYNTAKYIADAHKLDVIKLKQFREIDIGEWEGKTIQEVERFSKYDIKGWRKNPHLVKFPGEESLKNAQHRVMEGINFILDKHKGKNIVIVSHGGCLKLIIMGLINLDLSYYRSFWLGNTSLSIIDIKEDRNVISLLNDTNHLFNS